MPDSSRKTVTSYLYNTTDYLVDKPQRREEFERVAGVDTLIRRRSVYCDGLGYGIAPTRGHVSIDEEGVVGEAARQTKYNYKPDGSYEVPAYGNIHWTRDANGNFVETLYDATYHTFPVQVVNPLSQSTLTADDSVLGQPTQITDPNGAITRHEYDVFRRIIKTWKPTETASDPEAATIVYRYDTAPCSNEPNRVAIGVRKDGGGGKPSRRRYRYVFSDGLGREVQRQEDFETSTCLIRAGDVNDLRSAVNAQQQAVGLSASGWTDNPVGTSTRIKALHFSELRSATQDLWSQRSFIYDGDGVLRIGGQPSSQWHSVAPDYRVGLAYNTPYTYDRFGGRVVGWGHPNSFWYVLTDHLGSVHRSTLSSTDPHLRALPSPPMDLSWPWARPTRC